jgi:hypothetical protein
MSAAPKTDFGVVVAEAWGSLAPDWIVALARECTLASQSAVARRMACSGSALSAILRNRYQGSLTAFEELFRSHFQGAEIGCPQLGPIPAHECRQWREKAAAFAATNSLRVTMYRACRGCPRMTTGGAA